MKVNTVIFDFDGVIADSGAIFAEALQEVLKRKEPFSDAEIKQLRSSSAQEIIKLLGVKKWQLPMFVIKGKRAIAARMDQVEVFNDMPEAIKALHAEGYKLYILSTNNEAAIRNILVKNKLEKYFTNIYSGGGVFGKAKWLKKLLKKEQLDKTQCIYVGDETRDIEATKQVGLKSAAVTWGYNETAILLSYEPNAMVSKPQELKSKLSQIK